MVRENDTILVKRRKKDKSKRERKSIKEEKKFIPLCGFYLAEILVSE